MTAFPEITVTQIKRPQTLDLSDGEREVGLTEMIFPYYLENIDNLTEVMFDMIPSHLNVKPTDSNTYETGGFMLAC